VGIVPLSRNLGTLTSWIPLDLFRPVMGLMYLCLFTFGFLCRGKCMFRCFGEKSSGYSIWFGWKGDKMKCSGNGKVGGNMVNQDSGSEEKNGASMEPMGVCFKKVLFKGQQ